MRETRGLAGSYGRLMYLDVSRSVLNVSLVQLVDLPPGQHEREIDAHRRLEATLVLSSVALRAWPSFY